jgi:hypothetical protein
MLGALEGTRTAARNPYWGTLIQRSGAANLDGLQANPAA